MDQQLETKKQALEKARRRADKARKELDERIEEVDHCEKVYQEAAAIAGLNSELARRKRDQRGALAMFVLYLILFLIAVLVISLGQTFIGILFFVIAVLIVRSMDKRNPDNDGTSYHKRAQFFLKYQAYIPKGTQLAFEKEQQPVYSGADHVEIELLPEMDEQEE